MDHPTSTPNLQGVPATNLQHSYTKGTPTPYLLPPTPKEYHPPIYNIHTLRDHPPPTPIPQGVPPKILQQSYTKGTHHPTPPYPQPTRNTTQQSYNTHTLKGPPPPTPLPPTHRKYHPPSYNTHTPTII